MHHAVYLPLYSIIYPPRVDGITYYVHRALITARTRASQIRREGGSWRPACDVHTVRGGRHMHDMTPRRAGPPGLTAVQAGVW
jgi:hypothetical protein